MDIKRFAGVRNDVSPERFKLIDRDTGLTDLASGINIELDETGKPQRRLGLLLLDATPAHSLWADDKDAFVVRGGSLNRLNADMSFTNLGVAISGKRVRYCRIGADVFLSDGITNGCVSPAGYRTWGISVPTLPTVAVVSGDMRGGTYLYSTTYVRSSGDESGATPIQRVDIADNQGLRFTLSNSTDPLVIAKRVYISDTNGEVPYLAATVQNSDSTVDLLSLPASRTVAVRTLRHAPLPPGQVIGYYNGRMYVAENNFLWYSQPYEFELTHRAVNFLGFPSPIKTFAAVTDGIFIGTDEETVFLSGNDPTEFSSRIVASYGTVLGSETTIPNYLLAKGDASGPINAWMSVRGLCTGLDGGQFMNLTGGRFNLPDGVATGASLLKIRGGSPHLVTTLFS